MVSLLFLPFRKTYSKRDASFGAPLPLPPARANG
jgi:hypothetical protein